MIAFAPSTATPYSRLAIRSAVAMLPGNAANKQMPDGLIEDELDRHANRRRTIPRQRGLTFGSVLLEHFNQIVVEGGHLTPCEALLPSIIACNAASGVICVWASAGVGHAFWRPIPPPTRRSAPRPSAATLARDHRCEQDGAVPAP
jgi:hypothetical protein